MNRDDRLFAVIGGVVVTAVTIVFLVFAGGIEVTEEEPAPVRVAPILVEDEPAPSPEVVHARLEEPERAAGDDVVRSLMAEISAHPGIAAWLLTDNLLGRFVGAVEAVADGYSPREELDFLAPHRALYVREEDDRFFITDASFLRYDLATEVVSSIDAETAVALYIELEPRIREVRRDVAWHRGDFEDRLRQAVDHLLEVDIPDGPIEVERRAITYAFADDELERLSGAQRQLLRMGSDNARRVQQKLFEIRVAFGWPESAPPAEVIHAVTADDASEPPETEIVRIAEGPVDPAATRAASHAEDFSMLSESTTSVIEPMGTLIVAPFTGTGDESVAPVEEAGP
jgi:hypothetical protein